MSNGEFGTKAGNEISLINPWKKFGWPLKTLGIVYGGQQLCDGIEQKENLEQPVYC